MPAEPWARTLDALLRGVTHALSNRLATLSGLTQVLQQPGVEAPPVLAVLAGEVERLRGVVLLLPLLPEDEAQAPEPVLPAELLTELVHLHLLRTDLRDAGCALAAQPGVLPAWAHRGSLARLLLVLLERAALRACARPDASVRVDCTGDEAWTAIAVRAGAPDAGLSAAERQELEALRRAAGAEWEGEAAIRLPTLAAVRRAG